MLLASLLVYYLLYLFPWPSFISKCNFKTRIVRKQGSVFSCCKLASLFLKSTLRKSKICVARLHLHPNVLSYHDVALRKIQNDLRKMVNDFAETNTKLSGNISRLQGQVTDLKDTESKLDAIAKKQGSSVDKLKNLVKENQRIIDEKHLLIKSDTMQAMMAIVLESDFDQSSDFSDKEVNRLVLRLKNLPAIKVNEEKLRAKLEKNRSLASVLGLLQDIDDDTIPKEEHIIVVNEDDYAAQDDV